MDENRAKLSLSLVSSPGAISGGDDRFASSPLPRSTTLVELFASPRDVAAVGFALAQIPRTGRILWVQDRMSCLETGHPHGRASVRFGADPAGFVLAHARNAKGVLWTMEEGLRCSSLSAVIGEVWGDPRVLDFTATKRLAVRAEKQKVAVFLIRFGASATLSAARQRWRIQSLPSAPHPYDDRAPGLPCWRAELFRARGTKPGLWDVRYDRAAHRLDFSAPFRDPEVAEAQWNRSVATR